MPTFSLHEEAARLSGVSRERSEAAQNMRPSIFERHGEVLFVTLARKFYSRVYADEAFRRLFANTTREAAERNQAEMLSQQFGDERRLYAARKGTTALIGRHGPYPVTADGAATWLGMMEDSLRDVHDIGLCDEESRVKLMDYFRFTAAYIVIGREFLNPNRTVGYYGKHKEGEV